MAGTLNEAATVTIDGKAAEVDGSNNFTGTAQIGSGTTTVTLKAKDYSGNETTKQYEIDAAGSTTSYTYDANGNLTSDGTKMYFWNALNQLVEVKEGTTTTIATFEYDGAGRRTEKVAAGLTHQYIYDAEDIVEERITGSSSDTTRYYHGAGIDEPLARTNSSSVVTYYLADHLGSIVQETSSLGALNLEREYDAWGAPIQGGTTSGYSFTGREWNVETGLYSYRSRYYSPSLARWLSDDPIGLAGSINLSTYVGGNPTRLIDPFGWCGAENDQPPPVRVPGAPDLDWKWNPNPQNPRGGTWGAKGWKGPNPPNASWDPRGHWDVNDGKGNPVDHYDPLGNPITPGQAHPGNRQMMQIIGLVGTGYLIYRGGRMLPSLLPPLWPTIPLNLAIP